MRSADAHLAVVLGLLRPPRPVVVPLADALGLVLAVEVRAGGAIPPFDNSAMDGYAVRADDLPGTLRVVGESAAGHPYPDAHAARGQGARTLGAGETVRIMTGAPVPAGADTVVPQEKATRDGDRVSVASSPGTGAHIRRRGEDAVPGDVVVLAGVELRPRHLAAAASAGVDRVLARPRPRVAFLVTGDELVAPGLPLGPGQIHESNATYLAAALASIGAEPVDLGTVGDTGDAVRRAIQAADADLIVTTGGASVGDHDPVKEGLAHAGVEFVNIAIQPGKPQGAGVVDGVPVVCLPGNPVAVAVCVELFVGPAVRALRGVAEPAWEPMPAGADWRCPPGREQVMPVVVDGGVVRPATSGGSGSHLVARLAAAEGLARVPAEADAVAAGDIVWFRRFTA